LSSSSSLNGYFTAGIDELLDESPPFGFSLITSSFIMRFQVGGSIDMLFFEESGNAGLDLAISSLAHLIISSTHCSEF